jgi:hypothetical protein
MLFVSPSRRTREMSSGTDRNLLFGILPLQMDFVSRDQLIAAIYAWVLEKSAPLGKILRLEQVLGADELEFLDTLVAKDGVWDGSRPFALKLLLWTLPSVELHVLKGN